MLHTSRATVLFALIATVTVAACSPSQQHDAAADEAALTSFAANWEKAYNEKNAEALAALYTEDGQLLPPGVPVVNGRSAIQDFWANDIATSNATLAITPDATAVGGDWAWRAGSWRAIGADGSTAGTGKYIEVLRRTADGWQLHRDIWNADEAAPAAPAEGTAPAPSQP
jgi:uncharacterized protein (TIGR02246 family)